VVGSGRKAAAGMGSEDLWPLAAAQFGSQLAGWTSRLGEPWPSTHDWLRIGQPFKKFSAVRAKTAWKIKMGDRDAKAIVAAIGTIPEGLAEWLVNQLLGAVSAPPAPAQSAPLLPTPPALPALSARQKRQRRSSPRLSGWRLGTAAQPPSEQPSDDVHHIVVIGAGVAGLSAAKTAAAAAQLQGKLVQVTVLEGRDRVGGRIHTDVMDGGSRIGERKPKCLAECSFELGEPSDPSHHIPVDLGASFVHGCNKGNSVWRLSQEYGATLDESDGSYTEAWGGGCRFVSPDGARMVPRGRVRQLWTLSKGWIAGVQRSAAERHSKGEADISVDQAVREVGSSMLDALSTEDRQIVRSFMVMWQGYCSSPGPGVSNSDTSAWMSLESAWDQAPADTSTTEMASVEANWIPRRKSTREKLSPQQARERDSANLSDGMVVGGYGPFLVDNLVRECTDAGATIYRGCVVNEIRRRQRDLRSTRSAASAPPKPTIQVAYEKAGVCHTLAAHDVIVTLPVGVLRKSIETPADKDAKSQAAVKFDPPLSAEKQDAIRKIGMGTENKVLLRFKLDSEGKVFFAGPLLKSTKYWQVPDERFRFLSLHAMGKPGCLLVHVSPPHAFTTHEDGGRKIVGEVMAVLHQIFGDAVKAPVEMRVTQWHEDPFALGAYSYMQVGATVEDKRRLSKAEWDGHLHFAGEGCSIAGHQCVHGAYDTGQEAGLRACRNQIV
jgi:monoamine oxidase